MTFSAELAGALAAYRRNGDVGLLMDGLRKASVGPDVEELEDATLPYRDLPEVVIPVFETIVDRAPRNAQALVVLANAYWVTGRGPEVVGRLAERAMELEPANRGACHLWALSESDIRARMDRWREVAARFPSDQLARAALADNATAVASAEHDPLALDLAIATYEGLLAESINPAQSVALNETLQKLRSWKL